MTKIFKKNWKKAVKDSMGNISVIARRLGTSRKAVYDYMERRPEARDLIEEEKGVLWDTAELSLVSKMKEGDMRAIETLLLKHAEGRARGYGDKLDISSQNVNVNVDMEAEKKLKKLVEKIKRGETR